MNDEEDEFQIRLKRQKKKGLLAALMFLLSNRRNIAGLLFAVALLISALFFFKASGRKSAAQEELPARELSERLNRSASALYAGRDDARGSFFARRDDEDALHAGREGRNPSRPGRFSTKFVQREEMPPRALTFDGVSGGRGRSIGGVLRAEDAKKMDGRLLLADGELDRGLSSADHLGVVGGGYAGAGEVKDVMTDMRADDAVRRKSGGPLQGYGEVNDGGGPVGEGEAVVGASERSDTGPVKDAGVKMGGKGSMGGQLSVWRGQIKGTVGAGSGGGSGASLSSVLSQLFVSWAFSRAGAPHPTGECSGCSPESAKSTGSSAFRGKPASAGSLDIADAPPASVGTGAQYDQLLADMADLEHDMVACEKAEKDFNEMKFAAIEKLDKLAQDMLLKCSTQENIQHMRDKRDEFEHKCDECRNDPSVDCSLIPDLEQMWCDEGAAYRAKVEFCENTQDKIKDVCEDELNPILEQKSAACPLMAGAHSACPP